MGKRDTDTLGLHDEWLLIDRAVVPFTAAMVIFIAGLFLSAMGVVLLHHAGVIVKVEDEYVERQTAICMAGVLAFCFTLVIVGTPLFCWMISPKPDQPYPPLPPIDK
jgi:hypothetical protein